MTTKAGFRNLSWFWKLFCLVLLIITLTGIGVAVLIESKLSTQLHAVQHERGMKIVRNLSANVVDPILTDNDFQLYQQLDNLKNNESDVSYIYILDKDRKLRAHTFGADGFPKVLLSMNPLPADNQSTCQIFKTENESVHDINYPILKGELGEIHLGLSMTPIWKKIAEVRNELIAMVTAVFLIGVLAALFMARYISKPLNQLVLAAEQIGQRKFPGDLPVTSADEIGRLTSAFNQMRARLNSYELSEQEARAALLKEQQLLKIIFDTIEEGIIVCDQEGVLTRFNRTTTQLHAMPGETLPADQWSSHYRLYRADGTTPMQKEDIPLYRALQGEVVYNAEMVIRPIGSSARSLIANGRRLMDDQGHMLGAVVTLRDVTEQKQADARREELENDLRQKYKMEAVGIMAGGMAHNFNNNLAVILGNIELSLMKEQNPQIKEWLNSSKTAVMRSRDLIKQILIYSRKGSTAKTPQSITVIMEDTLKMLRATIPSSVRMKQEICPDCYHAHVNVDASQIQEILLNLINNAVHAMNEKGELNIRLDMVEIDDHDIPATVTCYPGRYARLSVEDTGCGIPQDILSKIFDPFFTTKELYEGTGMGLATVDGIMKDHDGWIQVNSVVGKGTRFDLYFPESEQLGTEGELSGLEQEQLVGGSEEILYIDDDPVLTKMGKEMLTEMGYCACVMNDSREALELFVADTDRFDLVITDQTMPELTGEELIKEIKAIRPKIPTILCTGYSSKIDEDKARELGIDAFMMKPIDFPRLLQTMRQLLDKRS